MSVIEIGASLKTVHPYEAGKFFAGLLANRSKISNVKGLGSVGKVFISTATLPATNEILTSPGEANTMIIDYFTTPTTPTVFYCSSWTSESNYTLVKII